MQHPMPGHGYRDPDDQKRHDQKQFSALMTLLLFVVIGIMLVGMVNAVLDRIDTGPKPVVTQSSSGYDCHNARVHYVRNTGNKVYFAVEGRRRTIVGTQADAWIQVGTVLDVCNR